MRYALLLLSLLGLMLPGLGQDDADSAPVAPRALPVPGAEQDAEAAREKLLKAADELDMIQGNSESTKVAVDGLKSDVTQLQAANGDLKQQLAALQAAFDRAEAERTKERQVLVDEVAQLVASRAAGRPAPRHHDADSASGGDPDAETAHPTEVHHPSGLTADSAPPADPPSEDPAPAPKPQKGYYHVVESGETLTMICAAYRDQGVKVSLSQVRKANGLTSKSVLKVGQKLFIPKPAT